MSIEWLIHKNKNTETPKNTSQNNQQKDEHLTAKKRLKKASKECSNREFNNS